MNWSITFQIIVIIVSTVFGIILSVLVSLLATKKTEEYKVKSLIITKNVYIVLHLIDLVSLMNAYVMLDHKKFEDVEIEMGIDDIDKQMVYIPKVLDIEKGLINIEWFNNFYDAINKVDCFSNKKMKNYSHLIKNYLTDINTNFPLIQYNKRWQYAYSLVTDFRILGETYKTMLLQFISKDIYKLQFDNYEKTDDSKPYKKEYDNLCLFQYRDELKKLRA